MGKDNSGVMNATPQLSMYKIEDYKRVNDAFTMYITRMLQGGIHRRLSKEAIELIEKYGSWYIQFPTFTYLRIHGFQSEPYRLPRYPTDIMILLEVVRQLLEFNVIQREKHRAGMTFPISVGKTSKVCQSAIAASTASEELAFYRFATYKKRERFNPDKKVGRIRGEKFIHKIDIEDYWANLMDEQAMKRRMWSRMLVDFMRKCGLFLIPNQVLDDKDHTHPQYESEMKKAILLPNWLESEEFDLNILMREVLSFSRTWVDIQMNKLVDMGVPFTFERMKPEESTFEDDQRTISDVRIHADEESQAPKRRKNTPGEVKARGKKIEEVKKKQKIIIPPLIIPSPPPSVSSIEVIEVIEQNKETQQCSNTVILPGNTQEFHATTTSAPSNENDDQPGSLTVLLEVSLGNEVYDWTRNNFDDNDDVISALRGLDREICLDDGMEVATIPKWLMRSMEKSKQMIEV